MKSYRRRFLVFIDWYFPAYKAGGPVQSVYNLVQLLKEEYDFYIVTSDQDIDGTPSCEIEQCNRWVDIIGTKTIYLSREQQKVKFYRALLAEVKPDRILVNGVLSLKFSILPLRSINTYNTNSGIKTFIAPRGMLGQEARNIKPFRKRLFFGMMKSLKAYKHITWLATSDEEARDIKSVLDIDEKYIRKVTNIGKLPQIRQTFPNDECFELLFLGRIHPIKNVKYAIAILGRLNVSRSIRFTLIGPFEDKEYLEECRVLSKKLPEHISVRFIGPVPSADLQKELHKYHALFLPTQGENYGQAIFECLGQGLPVLISDRTPWRNLAEAGVGFDISLNQPKQFENAMYELLGMDGGEYKKLSRNCYDYAMRHYNQDKLKALYLNAFGDMKTLMAAIP